MSESFKANALPAGDANRLALDLDELERQLRQLSAKPAAPVPQSDPMAELARLVGRDDPVRSLLLSPQDGRQDAAPLRSYPEPQPVAKDNAPSMQADMDGSQIYRTGHAYSEDVYEPQDARHAAARYEPIRHDGAAWGDAPDDLTARAPVADDMRFHAGGEMPMVDRDGGAEPRFEDPRDQRPADYITSPADYPPGYHVPPGDEADLVPLDNRRSRRGLITVAVLLGTAIVGVAGALSLRDSGPRAPSGEAPVITAEPGPARIAPQNPGGVEVPNQNKQIYERGAQTVPPATQVVNREEQPVDVRQTARALAQRDSIDRLIGATGAAPAPASGPRSESGDSALAALGEPKRVRTVAVRPDGTIVSEPSPAARPAALQLPDAAATAPVRTASASPAPAPVSAPVATPAPQPVTPAPASTAAAAPPPVNAAPAPALRTPQASATPAALPPPSAPAPVAAQPPRPAAAEPLSIVPNAQQKLQQRVASAPIAAAPAVPAAAAPVSTGGGDFMVQLAARPSEKDALDAFGQLQRRYPDLSGFSPVVRRAEVGDKTIYRLRVGSMSREEANALCSKLQASGGQCFVARN